MYLTALFALGGLIGLIASIVTRTRGHRARFNNVAVAVLGVLLGGLLLPRLAGRPEVASLPWLPIAAMTAAAFAASLAALRR